MTGEGLRSKPDATRLPETNMAAAAAILWEHAGGALPVVSESSELAGIVTDQDICIVLGTRNRRASELMALEVMNETIRQLAKR